MALEKSELVLDDDIKLQSASTQDMDKFLTSFLNVIDLDDDSESNESKFNQQLQKFVLESTERDPKTGRLIMPALFNKQMEHLLSPNINLAKQILQSNLKKFSKNPDKFLQYDNVIKEQLENNIIEEITDINSFVKQKNVSFLAHGAVFRKNHMSTKCRVVFFSNLFEKSKEFISHNQCSFAGSNLNNKLLIALSFLRFDKYLLIYDLVKAFLQIKLREIDTKRLCFFWFRNVAEGDYSMVAYRILRLPFGMRFSPFLLLMALNIILMRDPEMSDDDEQIKQIKREIYNLSYMDNLAYSCNEENDLFKALKISKETFASYGFQLQQFATNSNELHNKLELDSDSLEQKLLGVLWNTQNDSFKSKPLHLNIEANTKRTVLQTLNSNFYPLGTCIPLLNRAKTFLHELQLDKRLEWDSVLDIARLKQWHNIAKQVNNSPVVEIPRFLGKRNDKYTLHVFSDASKELLGCVLYLQSSSRNDLQFLLAKSRTVNSKLMNKSIPVLELVALEFGVSTAIEIFTSFKNAVCPINIEKIHAYTDSSISINWVTNKAYDITKIEKKRVFVLNRLQKISELCETKEIFFHHIDGVKNPADPLTRCVSSKILNKTNFLTGPKVEQLLQNDNTVLVPHPQANSHLACFAATNSIITKNEPVFNIHYYSSFKKTVGAISKIFQCIHKLKKRLVAKDSEKYSKFKTDQINFSETSSNYVLGVAQRASFPNIFDYFENKKGPRSEIPIITQLNLFLDKDGLLRVQSKMRKLRASYNERCPVLLAKDSPITKAIIWDLHSRTLKHAGAYKVLAHFRKEFYIPSAFATVRKILDECLLCKRSHGRCIKLNQNAYRDFRINPEKIPFRNCMVDHIGPFSVREGKVKNKVYILIVTCLWSRAVNLVLCPQIDTNSFLRALQLHIFSYGVPSLIASDNGSPIVSGVKRMQKFLSDPEVNEFLESHNIKKIDFEPYPANASKLGGLVESLVKETKKLIRKSIQNNVLNYHDFDFLVQEAKMLINKRGIAFQNSLNDLNNDLAAIAPLTPELILRGYEVPCVNILPQLQNDFNLNQGDNAWEISDEILENNSQQIFKRYEKLRRVKKNLEKLYQDEFIANLIKQATDRKDRYSKQSHKILKVGDLVSIKMPNTKPFDFPLGIVVRVEMNDLNEVVSAEIRKANKEVIRRHADDIIFLSNTSFQENEFSVSLDETDSEPKLDNAIQNVSKRNAAKKCMEKNQALASNNLV